MTSSKHERQSGEGPFTSDLEQDPGIGQSKGLFRTGDDPDLLQGGNTQQGDVENDSGSNGEAREGQVGRTDA